MTAVLIRLKNLTFAYDQQQPVLQGINLAIRSGERLALVGANGAGKTTLLQLIVGLLTPCSGQIEAFGKTRIKEQDFQEVRARVGLLFQDADDQLFCPTVLEDVAFGPLNLGKSRTQARLLVTETLTLLGLRGFEHKITYKLSGGEKRLVSLATILAMKPDLLLLDEPTASLDKDAVNRLTSVLKSLPAAMLIVSHDENFRHQVTTRSLILQQGMIQPAGRPKHDLDIIKI
ncbi:energy-coupling factor ABC transporter ATP-binding protein [candidate division CSSED10-310 bacterium]|uniref:Energy-coupling factor ABC transporter ATP-binding protein n=1 Tax=candidate division CSSED10-310 bacterium TaxID=2855610 RepID=A0ABV6YR72_UNCC1